MRPYDAPGISKRFWVAPPTRAGFEGFSALLGDALARTYTVTLPPFVIAFFVLRLAADNAALPFVLALVWLGATFLSAVLLALNDRRRAVALGFGRLRHAGSRPLAVAADTGSHPGSWRTAPPATAATCRPGSTGPRHRTGTTCARTASTSRSWSSPTASRAPSCAPGSFASWAPATA